jgi:hypothetical protein
MMYDELVDRLRCDGLEPRVENTGGNVMVLFVQHPDRRGEYGVSAEADDDRYLLCYYPRGYFVDALEDPTDQAGIVAEELTAEQVVSFVRRRVV